jgi:hypothetical protein
LGQRLLRRLFYNVVRLPDRSLFLTFAKQIAVFRDGRLVPVEGLRRPFRVLRGSAAVDDGGNAYFGEYDLNPDRTEICVYCLPAATSKAEVVHVFPARSIRHVHGVFYEAARRRLWCTTGDRGRECRICVSDDSFRSLAEVGAGDETWRCVGLSFGRKEAFYGTDAEFRANHLYRLDTETGHRTRIAEVDGPVYYAARRGSTHFFGTAAEGCPSQPINAASIWCVEPSREPRCLASWAKDPWPKVMMHGTLHFTLGSSDVNMPLLCYLHGLSGQDERTVAITPVCGGRLH